MWRLLALAIPRGNKMRKITVTVGPLVAASSNNIVLTQTPTAGLVPLTGSLAVNGIATLDTPRRVLITSTGNESANTFTITGTNWSGQIISEQLAGPNATTAYSVLDYATVTSIKISNNAVSALTIGTNGVAGSSWVRLDEWALPTVSIQANVSGTVNYTIQQTLDDPNSPTNSVAPSSVTWLSSPDAAAVAATTSIQTGYSYPPTFVRVLLNSGTGLVTMTVVQSGVNPA